MAHIHTDTVAKVRIITASACRTSTVQWQVKPGGICVAHGRNAADVWVVAAGAWRNVTVQ